MIAAALTAARAPDRELRVALVSGTILSLLFVIMVAQSGGDLRVVLLFPALALVSLLQVRFTWSLGALVACLYLDIHLSIFSSAVVYSLIVGIAFLLHHQDIEQGSFTSPVSVPLAFYCLCALPSFANAVQPLMSVVKLLNAASFVLVLYVCTAALRSVDDIRRLWIVYLACGAANALDVIVEAGRGVGRPFGFAGIMFGDYAGLGLCVALALAVAGRGKEARVAAAVAALFIVGLVLTQTRNSWLASGATVVIMGAFSLLRPGVTGIPRVRLIRAGAAGTALLIVIAVAVLLLTPRVAVRALNATESDRPAVDEEGLVSNSLVSRAMIWDTALNAFRAHPIIGVGVYGFPEASKMYSRLPPLLYENYVFRNSAHQTHLAVLSETGLLGGAGYLVFMVACVSAAFRTIARSGGGPRGTYAFAGTSALMYIVVSMFFTDAWMWGQGIVLFALALGSIVALDKLPREKAGAHAVR